MVLMTITGIAVLVALGMSVLVWRMARDERARSAARVAALSAAVREGDPIRVATRPATVAEAPAGQMAVGGSRSAAPWAPARVASFTGASRSGSAGRATPSDEWGFESEAVNTSFLTHVASPDAHGRQRGLAIATLSLAVVLAGGLVWGLRDHETSAVTKVDESPLELVSLRHERLNGRLAVTGLVRNPVAGAPLEKLGAVVFLFDQQGNFLTSGRADVDFVRLQPGDESPFVISVDAPSTVSRYRVSFRDEAGVVRHVDRRAEEPAAPNAVS
jgi:hypothetical protein